jgi:hypothetical protein
MNWLDQLFSKIEGWFSSPKAKAVEQTIANLLPVAVTIVQDINAIAPNKTLVEFNAVATKYAVPAISAIAADPNAAGNVALNLATQILEKNHAPGAAVSLLNTVVQLAVTAVKTQAA